MKRNLFTAFGSLCLLLLAGLHSKAQINLLQDYKNYTSATIGTFQGISFREAGFSALFPIAGTNGKEFWTCSDRGVNVDAANANPPGCTPTYDKIYGFPTYAPKIHRIRLNGDSIQILRTITMKRPGGTNATGLINPTGFGSTDAEQASTDTVMNCANFNNKIAAKDIWGIDAEGLAVDKEGNFWICEEGGPTIWKLNQNGVVVKRYSPYANLLGAQTLDVLIDTAFKYRKNNRGFEGLAIAPNGKIYTMIQSPILYPSKTVGENTRIHRLLEIDPVTNTQRMLVYLNDGIIGASGANQVRLRDWKIGDIAAINDTTFLVLEAALRGTTDIKKVYKINIANATPVNSGYYGGQTLENLVDSAGIAFQGITPVKKTLFMDLLANGWDPALEKPEGIAILNDSTVFIANDNDYGQVSLLENGIATPTPHLSHVIKYGLKGSNKLVNFNFIGPKYSQGSTAQGSSQAPYVVPVIQDVQYTSLVTANDNIGGYKMVGIPDGMGGFDNGNGTFTVLMNHELGNTSGNVRAHGAKGAFVSKWIINKSDLSVVSGADLANTLKLWNATTSSYITYNSSFTTASAALNRFCSADLPPVSAFYNTLTGKGTQERIFMNGEENGNDGRAFGHIVTGPEAGISYELPYLGKLSWENSVASARSSDQTIVAGLDDQTPGQVYFYVGSKTTTGNTIEKAGLSNGKVFGVSVAGMITETSAAIPAANTPFTLVDLGSVQSISGTTLNTNSNNNGVTTFLRPEDGAWDPSNPNDFYFATTNAFNSPTRIWKLHFNNMDSIALGGAITAVLDGTEGGQMFDNLAIDHSGHMLIVEDVGGNAHIGKVWQYTMATDSLKQIAGHDTTRFITGSANYLTQDEEATGIFDAQHILGAGMFLVVDQAHYGISGEVVEGGQLLAFNNPATAATNPEVNLQGNGITIADNDLAPSASDHTDFGNVTTGDTISRTFIIQNTGLGNLIINRIVLSGTNATAFALVNPPAFPLTISANGSQTFVVQHAPVSDGLHTATINIMSNDFSEDIYDVALQGTGVSPEINIQGNSLTIMDGDPTPGAVNNTDFGTVTVGANLTKTFTIQNTGQGELNISGISFTGANATEFTLPGAPAFPMTIAAGGSQVVTVQFAPLSAGIRTASISIANSDADETVYDFALQGIATLPTSISNTVATASMVKLYPNPAGNSVTIAMTLKNEGQVIVAVYDMNGKQALQNIDRKLGSGVQQLTLNTAGLANGTYFVQIATGTGVEKIKMIIAH